MKNFTRPVLVSTLVALAGCTGSTAVQNGALPSDERAIQAVMVIPEQLLFNNNNGHGGSQTFDAFTQFAGDITAVSSNPYCAQVNPPDEDVSTPPTSPAGVKSAVFTVTPGLGQGRCTITVTDKKGNQATVSVSVIGGN